MDPCHNRASCDPRRVSLVSRDSVRMPAHAKTSKINGGSELFIDSAPYSFSRQFQKTIWTLFDKFRCQEDETAYT